MTNRQWMELIAKEFGVSNSKAKSMLSAMYRAYDILKVNKDVRKKIKEDKEKLEKELLIYEQLDEMDDIFMRGL